MRKMKEQIHEAQAIDRKQINEGFQQLRESMHTSISTLDEKVNDYTDEVNGRLKAFAALQALSNEQSFEKKTEQNQKLREIIEATEHHEKEFRHLDSGLRTFSTFEIKAPVGSDSLVVTKSDLYGAKSGTYFEFPEMIQGAQNSLSAPNDFHEKVITKISACVGVGIYSV